MFDYDTVYNFAIKYFNGDDLATKKWIEKYCLKDKNGVLYEKTPDDMHRRLAKEFARIELNYPNPVSEEEIYNLLKDFKYIIPQGSPMYGIGNNFAMTSLSNCFVVGNDSDSYGGIMMTDQEQVQLMKRRGGVGHDISHLRPAGSLANNSVLGSKAGSTLYMERYSNSTREVAQDGRRGALMLSIDVRHPDTEGFVDIKLQEGKVTGANISVKISDEFMEAVKKDDLFIQSFPIDCSYIISDLDKLELNKLYEDKDLEGDTIYLKKIKAKELWDKIIKNAHASAEPGILFWDKVVDESPADVYGKEWKTVSTNPCFTGDTVVAVADGRNGVTIKELSDSKKLFPVYSARPNKSSGNKSGGWKTEIKMASAFETGTKKVLMVTLSDGSSFKCTPDHRLALDDCSYVQAKDSLDCEISKFYSFSNKNSGKSYRHINSMTNGKSRQYRMIWEFNKGEYDGKLFNVDHKDDDSTNDLLVNLQLLNIKEHKTKTDRTGENNPAAKVAGSRKHLLMNRRKNILANAKRYGWSDEKLNGLLCGFDIKFGKELEGLNCDDENVYLNEKVKVVSIEEFGFEPVYDLTVEDNHNFFIITKTDDDKFLNSSGILVHNCGEIPLCPYDSCRLLAINLYSYVVKPFTKEAYFDFPLFRKHVRIAQRMMDDMVDLEIEKINTILAKIESDPEPDEIKNVELNAWLKIKDKAVKGRRTGLGITAEGDMLAALNMRYGSDVAIKFAVEVQKTLAVESYSSSIIMADERGPFPIWNIYNEQKAPFIQRVLNAIADESSAEQMATNTSVYSKYLKKGRRNISNLTIAPTGTVSLMAQTTSGIEPLFMPFYKRRAKTDDLSRVVFTDEVGDTWEEFFVIHPKFKQWYDINYNSGRDISELKGDELETIFKNSPYYKATANDIDWVSSVKMQGAIQKWVDHSISKTVNVPKDTSVETVNQIYLTAHKEGCKGVTIYRDGSRSGVLIKNEDKDISRGFDYTDSYKRPKVTECDIYHKQALGKKWTVLIGKVDGKPFEVFTIAQIENHIFPNKIKHGTITKVKSKTYRLEGMLDGEKYSIDNFITMMSVDERTNTRKYSAMLRHGMNPRFIVKEISEFATIVSFDKVIQRVLMNYVHEQVKEECPSCGSSNYHAVEGCWTCKDCGYAKCG